MEADRYNILEEGTAVFFDDFVQEIEVESGLPPKSTTETIGRKDWSHLEVKALIEAYKLHQKKFTSPMHNKKSVWEIISQELTKQHGIYRPATKCDEKWRNLKKSYDRNKLQNETTGNSKSNFQYFNDLYEVFHKNPQFYPLATASSSGKLSVNSKSSTTMQEPGSNTSVDKSRSPIRAQNSDNSSESTPTSSKKRKAMSLREYEANKERRHRERMDQKQKSFDWFKEYLEKSK